MASPTRQIILATAQRLFAERGYSNVTIRQIAAEAGVSPAMVMKVGHSKERLYAAAAPVEQEPLSPDWPTERIGRELVRRVIERRDRAAAEPWLQALIASMSSPDPGQARERFRTQIEQSFVVRFGSGADAPVRAEMIAAALVGLAAAIGPMRMLLEPELEEQIVDVYGAAVQSIVDRAL